MEKTKLKKNKIDNIIKLNNKKLNKYNNVNEIFDVVSRIDGENHYRLQRIEKADIQSNLP